MRSFSRKLVRPLAELDQDEFGIDPSRPLPERVAVLEAAHKRTLVERRRITGLQRSQLLAVVVYGVVLVAAGFLWGKHLSANTNQIGSQTGQLERQTHEIGHAQQLAASALTKSEKRHAALRSYQIASCKRGNESRASENRSHRDDYLFDTTLASLLHISLSQPSTPDPNLTSEEQHGDLQRVKRFVGSLTRYADDKEWRSLIPNCEKAVDDPSKYVLPPPTKFTSAMPPPAALEIRAGE